MAMSLFIRSNCKASMSPMLLNVSRITCSNNLSVLNKKSAQVEPSSSFLSQNIVRSISASPVRLSGHGGSHVTLWSLERAISLGLLAIVPVSIAYPSQIGDGLLALSMVMHAHWGLEAVVTDYVRESIFGSIIPKAAHGLLLLFSAATLAGLCLIIYNDVGIAKTIRKIWAIKPKE